uniref:PB1 domain-containing protein n=1 Tax=Oryza glumipatula TaxID=40148 RepID=A0A0D9ZIF1_9ORYZ
MGIGGVRLQFGIGVGVAALEIKLNRPFTGEYGSSVRMMVSYGGEIVQGDHGPDGKAAAPCYAGGVHRIVKVGLSERLAELRQRMAALAGCRDVCIRYALPGEGLGRLRDVANDGDLWGLVSLLFCHDASKTGRVRVFLFAVEAPLLRSASAPSSLPALVEEDATTAVSGGAITLGLPRSASSPSLATSDSGTAVRMKVSYGGEIIQQQRGGSAAASCYYAGGVHRIVRVGLSERLASLRTRLAALAGFSGSDDVRIRYALPGEEGLHLHDVASDGDLWSLVSLLFFHEAVMATSSKPKQGRIRVFLFAADDAPATSSTSPPAAPLRRSASSPFLPTLVEEDEDDGDTETAAATQTIPSRVTATVGMRRSASSPALAMAMATTSSSSDAAAAASTSSGATSGSSGDSDTPAMTSSSTAAAAAVQFGPVVLVPVMVVFPVIPVYPIGVVDYRGVLLPETSASGTRSREISSGTFPTWRATATCGASCRCSSSTSRVMATSSKPKQGRIRVFLFAADDAPVAPPLRRRSASSPSLVDVAKHQGALPALAEEEEDMDIDTAAATSPAGVSVTRTGQGMRRSASSPALAPPQPSESGTAAATSTSSSSSGDGVQFAPVVWGATDPRVAVYPLFTCCVPRGIVKTDNEFGEHCASAEQPSATTPTGGAAGLGLTGTPPSSPRENNGERQRAEAVDGSAADESVVEELGDADQEASTGEGDTASPSTTSMGELLSSPPDGTAN